MCLRFVLASACWLSLAGAASAEIVLNRDSGSDPSSLDQHRTTTAQEGALLRDLYEGLVTEDGKGELIPGVAQSWDISSDGLTYTFRLRENAKWSNGDPVTAGDFEYSLRRIMDPKTGAGYASILYPIRNAREINTSKLPVDQLGVQALDDHTLKITLASPTPYFLSILAHQTALPLNRKAVEKYGDKFTMAGNMVSNGAYTLVSFTPNAQIVMKKNPYFWDAGSVRIDVVNWVPFEEPASCMRRFEAGELQICGAVAAEQMDYIKANLGKNLRVAPYFGIYYVSVKGEPDGKLRDPRVRQAISMAIDRNFLASEIRRGMMVPGYSMVPPGTQNYVADAPRLEYKDQDILDREDRARQLLAEAGVTPGSLSVKLRYATSINNKNSMIAIADMLKNIGIEASQDEVESTTYFNYLYEKGMYDFAYQAWIGDYNDPYSFLSLFTTGNYFNMSDWSNKDYDALITRSETTTDAKARAETLAEAERILLKEVPVIPLLYPLSQALVSERVEGYSDNLTNVHATRWLSLKTE
ncbi:ABC transporter substrate-binding protein [Ochrobactrum sp. 695/2009]|nr:peptide ABC transporter substrate-binding protein [Brucella intermedia]PJR88529.1 ABC transporter substrate-binding protein [Ochrobactrum sp. 721/2009]PJT14390.1 ABC transporter substrate-binding protein [Ochrobactrum sp. 720/2009]PJT22446.1 ABC transporter substrate-binding protein [Ochrobactrum sp. 715/2009]PJT28749.1 ABC transporter substrate-binding protein [Ochrobactrum sp. 695/2009]PJT34183.1 ABC transporter substrate-binding protein [Ochrobactrum sp. 689/2009]